MRVCRHRCVLVALLAAFATSASAQLAIPRIVQLPDEDFTWTWGNARADDLARPDFEITGFQRQFQCELTGGFRPASHMRDFYSLREFEATLRESLYFIEDATITLNELYQRNELDWSIMNCFIPQGTEDEDKIQERLDKARERAERQRERRRAREDDD